MLNLRKDLRKDGGGHHFILLAINDKLLSSRLHLLPVATPILVPRTLRGKKRVGLGSDVDS